VFCEPAAPSSLISTSSASFTMTSQRESGVKSGAWTGLVDHTYSTKCDSRGIFCVLVTYKITQYTLSDINHGRRSGKKGHGYDGQGI
jgi:hypothetical protein